MNTRTLTSANAILMIGVKSLFDTAQRVQGFATDDITDTDAISQGQVAMGLDGRLSAGFVPTPIAQNITLQGDSESIDLFETWNQTERQVREKYEAFGLLIVPSVQKRFTMTRGFMTSIPVTPSLKAIVQARRFTITWEKVESAPYF